LYINEKELEVRCNLLKEVDTNEVAECYLYIGRNNKYLGNLDKAIEAYEISLNIGTKLFG
jgi:tetratricopeptide (TPR) repeat protein